MSFIHIVSSVNKEGIRLHGELTLRSLAREEKKTPASSVIINHQSERALRTEQRYADVEEGEEAEEDDNGKSRGRMH